MSNLSASCVNRIKRDVMAVFSEPLPLIFVFPDEDEILKVYAFVVGPFDTPYEGGFFKFLIEFPTNYPLTPPKVTLLTTDNGRVRFNPNLYSCGKVCLSILGTWSGPGWRPINTISSVLLSIQSLLNEKPYHNEPAYEKVEARTGDSDRYNDVIRHETIRAAVCNVMETRGEEPEATRVMLESHFMDCYESYIKTCDSYAHLDEGRIRDPFHSNERYFNFTKCIERLNKIYSEIKSKSDEEDGESSSSSLSDGNE